MRILIIDDNPAALFGMRDFLEQEGHEVAGAGDCATAARLFAQRRPDAVIADFNLPDGNALRLLDEFLEQDPAIPVIVVTGQGSIELAVEAIKRGADNYLLKPVDLVSLSGLLTRRLDASRTARRDRARRSATPEGGNGIEFGVSPVMRKLLEDAARIAQSDRPVLILGETGVGKGVLARWIHQHGPRRKEPWVEINCASLTGELLASELFGHERGAFTGADAAKEGLIEVAHRGSFFMDEIGDASPAVQAQMLKVLEDGRFRRLGATRERETDIRLITATHRQLASLIPHGQFREDLYYRIGTTELKIPPLRERLEDLEPIARDLLRRIARESGRPAPQLDEATVAGLRRHRWPGNIRELRNVLERGCITGRYEVPLTASGAASGAGRQGGGEPYPSLAAIEQNHIEKVLASVSGHVGNAARVLGLSRSTLYSKLKELHIDASRFRNPDQPAVQ